MLKQLADPWLGGMKLFHLTNTGCELGSFIVFPLTRFRGQKVKLGSKQTNGGSSSYSRSAGVKLFVSRFGGCQECSQEHGKVMH